jgi:signal transduction histidine kinase
MNYRSAMFLLCTCLGIAMIPALPALGGETPVPVSAMADYELKIHHVQLDGEWQVVSPGAQEINTPPGNHSLGFMFGQVDTDEHCLRLRYKLEGIDKQWKDFGEEGMRVTVRFQNSSDDIVGENNFKVLGDSPGWHGSITNSQFLPTQQQVTVPEGAVKMVLLLVSGGPVENLGVLVIDDLKVSVTDPQTGKKEAWLNYDFDSGTDYDSPRGVPTGWVRGGLRRDCLQVVQCNPASTNRSLAALDYHIRSFGEWYCTLPIKPHAKPGDILTLDWLQMYSVGVGGQYKTTYDLVPPGHYTFRLVGLAVPSGEEMAAISLPIDVPVPFLQSIWFAILCVGIGSASVGMGVRYLTQRHMQLQMERLQWQQSLDRERTRIARDIHDDIGSGLTRISMLSEAACDQLSVSAKPLEELHEITATTREIVVALDEIVWAVNPSHDKLDSLVAYCGKYAQEFFRIAGVQCRLDLDFNVPDWPLTSQMRHHLFLSFKEVLNNSVRHAHPTSVRISFTMESDSFALTVQDNGTGFNPDNIPKNNGLINMRQRLKEIGGECIITSSVGGGTTVKLICKQQP